MPTDYYRLDAAGQPVPLLLDGLREQLAAGALHLSTLVWAEGRPDWLPLSSFPELLDAPPHPSKGTHEPPGAAEPPAGGEIGPMVGEYAPPFIAQVSGAAAAAGVRVGDLLLAVDGVRVTPEEELSRLVPRGREQFVFTLLRRRGGEAGEVEVCVRRDEQGELGIVVQHGGEEEAEDGGEETEEEEEGGGEQVEAAAEGGEGEAAEEEGKPAAWSGPLLVAAVEKGEIGELASLLRDGGDPNAFKEEDGSALLHIAAAANDVRIVRLLVLGKADVNIAAPDGSTPLGAAALAGAASCVESLLAAHAAVGMAAADGATALHLAAENGSEASVSALLQASRPHHASREGRGGNRGGRCAMPHLSARLSQAGAPIDALTLDDWASPLLVACFNGHAAAAQLLIDANADLDTPNAEDATALHVACHNGAIDCVRRLVGARADLTLRTSLGETALHVACGASDAAAVELLLAARADVAAMTHEGATPLHVACGAGSAPCVAALLGAAAAAGGGGGGGGVAPPLHVACEAGWSECAALLLEAGADADAPSAVDGSTPLFVALLNEHSECVEVLVEAGADVNLGSADGGYPLCLAASYGNLLCVQVLLEGGAQPELTYNGETALDLAVKFEHAEVAELLRDALEHRQNQQEQERLLREAEEAEEAERRASAAAGEGRANGELAEQGESEAGSDAGSDAKSDEESAAAAPPSDGPMVLPPPPPMLSGSQIEPELVKRLSFSPAAFTPPAAPAADSSDTDDEQAADSLDMRMDHGYAPASLPYAAVLPPSSPQSSGRDSPPPVPPFSPPPLATPHTAARPDVGAVLGMMAELRQLRDSVRGGHVRPPPPLPADIRRLAECLAAPPPAAPPLVGCEQLDGRRAAFAELQQRLRRWREAGQRPDADECARRDRARQALCEALRDAEARQLAAWGASASGEEAAEAAARAAARALTDAADAVAAAAEEVRRIRRAEMDGAADERQQLSAADGAAALRDWEERHSSEQMSAKTEKASLRLRKALSKAADATNAEAERSAAEEIHAAVDELLPQLHAERRLLTDPPDPSADLHATAAVSLLHAARGHAAQLRRAAAQLAARLEQLGAWRAERRAAEAWVGAVPSRGEYLRACGRAAELQAAADQLAARGGGGGGGVALREEARKAWEARDRVAAETMAAVGAHFPELAIDAADGWRGGARCDAEEWARARAAAGVRCAEWAHVARKAAWRCAAALRERAAAGAPPEAAAAGGEGRRRHGEGEAGKGEAGKGEVAADPPEVHARRLTLEGHKANSNGDFHAARRSFLAAYELQRKPSAMISAANMALKSGETEAARSAYESLLQMDSLTPSERAVVERKLAEAALKLETHDTV
ncbi:hypothetical protein AB1Y20_005847 [Prymnesium parvum]|uniref:PDZ domain-containing protein n=1 Tax=Prymnesium parvum TaxID=97485 RepID=A0AB34J0Q9_PRYPA